MLHPYKYVVPLLCFPSFSYEVY